MNRDELFQSIKEGNINRIYLFYGQETYIMASAIDAIRRSLSAQGAEPDYISVDGRNVPGEQIVELCLTVSFVSPCKLIVVDNLPQLTAKDAPSDERLLEYADAPDDDAVLVFTCTADAVKTSPLFKKLSKHACAVDFTPLSDRELGTFIRRELKKYSKSITQENTEFLISYTDTELNKLQSELNKLALGSEHTDISREDIENIVTPSRDYKIFKLTDYIFDGDTLQAVQLTDLLLMQKEEPVYIIAVLAKTVHNCIMVKSMRGQGIPDAQICAGLGIKEFVLGKLSRYCRRYSMEKLTECAGQLLAADEKIKTSSVNPGDCLTGAVMRINGILKSSR